MGKERNKMKNYQACGAGGAGKTPVKNADFNVKDYLDRAIMLFFERLDDSVSWDNNSLASDELKNVIEIAKMIQAEELGGR